MRRAAISAVKNYGKLDAAINCAGIGIAMLTYNNNTDRVHNVDDYKRVLEVG